VQHEQGAREREHIGLVLKLDLGFLDEVGGDQRLELFQALDAHGVELALELRPKAFRDVDVELAASDLIGKASLHQRIQALLGERRSLRPLDGWFLVVG